jgi:hypothetical protein
MRIMGFGPIAQMCCAIIELCNIILQPKRIGFPSFRNRCANHGLRNAAADSKREIGGSKNSPKCRRNSVFPT